MENIKEWIVNAPENFKQFIIDNNTNPLLWISLLAIGIALFFITYRVLTKNKNGF